MKNLFIFGEVHNNPEQVAQVQQAIIELKPDYLLHELLYQDVALRPADIKARLDECTEGGRCDPRLNKDIYELGLREGYKLVGIDPHIKQKGLTLGEQFRLREEHMATMIRAFEPKGRVCVVVGDIHLRSRMNRLFPRSEVYEQLSQYATIIRAPMHLREAQ